MVGFIIIGVMDTQWIAKLILSLAAKLALKLIALTDGSLQGSGETWSVLSFRDSAKPSWVIFAHYGFCDLEPPFENGSAFLATIASGFSHFRRPCGGYFLCHHWPLTALEMGFRLTSEGFAHLGTVLTGALIGRFALAALGRATIHQFAACWTWRFLDWHGEIVP